RPEYTLRFFQFNSKERARYHSARIRSADCADCADCPDLLSFFEEAFPTRPRFLARLAVGFTRIGRFPGAHEPMPRAIVSDGVKRFARRLHLLTRVRNRCADARIVARIEAVHGSFDARHRVGLRGRSIENERGREVSAIGREAE